MSKRLAIGFTSAICIGSIYACWPLDPRLASWAVLAFTASAWSAIQSSAIPELGASGIVGILVLVWGANHHVRWECQGVAMIITVMVGYFTHNAREVRLHSHIGHVAMLRQVQSSPLRGKVLVRISAMVGALLSLCILIWALRVRSTHALVIAGLIGLAYGAVAGGVILRIINVREVR